MLNNKGQSLILFIIMLPILLLILILGIDVGGAIVLKQELVSISDVVLDYGLDNIDKENLEIDLEKLAKLNKNDTDKIEIQIDDGKIYMGMIDTYDGILSNMINIPIFKVKTSYVSYIENNEKRIERIGD